MLLGLSLIRVLSSVRGLATILYVMLAAGQGLCCDTHIFINFTSVIVFVDMIYIYVCGTKAMTFPITLIEPAA
jgi:hypothetical protein